MKKIYPENILVPHAHDHYRKKHIHAREPKKETLHGEKNIMHIHVSKRKFLTA